MFEGAYGNDGQYAQGRLTLGMTAWNINRTTLGFEVGLQSGNSMRLSVDQTLVDAAGELQWQSSLKPFIDLLLTSKTRLSTNTSVYLLLDAGIAYRQLILEDRNSSSDSLSKVSPEIHIGLGYQVTQHVMASLFYQGIYSSSKVGAKLDSNLDSLITKITTQQAGLIGIQYFW